MCHFVPTRGQALSQGPPHTYSNGVVSEVSLISHILQPKEDLDGQGMPWQRSLSVFRTHLVYVCVLMCMKEGRNSMCVCAI